MSDFDPFAAVTADEAQTAEPAKRAAPKKAPARVATASLDEGKVTVTLKGGGGFEEPWIVIHAANVAEAVALLSAHADVVELMDLTQQAAKAFRERSTVAPKAAAASGGAGYRSGGAPAGAQAAPAGSPECPPGWEFKSGANKTTGKPWKGFFPPRGSTEKPLFF
ncbi:hypothetical protein AB0G00_23810 [Nocardia salmonicida]|uniref:hypothetical protein n=1 Tax=Nocardia salmonicida TaxID=53431 RepID=UPI0034098B4D